MADVIDHKIFGDDLQLVEIELDPGEGVRAEAGTMTYMETDIEMQTTTGGGIFKGLKRAITGESFFITTFLNNGQGKSHVSFAAPYPGKIIPINILIVRINIINETNINVILKNFEFEINPISIVVFILSFFRIILYFFSVIIYQYN